MLIRQVSPMQRAHKRNTLSRQPPLMNRYGLPAYALRHALRSRPRVGLLSTSGGELAEADAVRGDAEQAEPLHLAEFARRQTLCTNSPSAGAYQTRLCAMLALSHVTPYQRTIGDVVTVEITERKLHVAGAGIHVWFFFQPTDERARPFRSSRGQEPFLVGQVATGTTGSSEVRQPRQ